MFIFTCQFVHIRESGKVRVPIVCNVCVCICTLGDFVAFLATTEDVMERIVDMR